MRSIVTRRAALAAICACLTAGAGCGGAEEEPPPLPQTTTTPEQRPAGPPARSRGGPAVTTLVTGLEIPWEIAFLPDGRALITERPGRVRLLGRDRRLRRAPLAIVPTLARGASGLLGLAVDPEFAGNKLVYLYRTTRDDNEVLRYRLDDDGLREDAVILNDIPSGPFHDGGRIHFGPDGALYVSTGEAGDGPAAQQRDSRGGKFLRLEPNDYRRSGGLPQLYSLGHRNAQGFDWQPGSGRLVSTEHGPSGGDGPQGFDEVNVVRRGGNYGWPRVFGNRRDSRYVSPIIVYEEAIAPSGATFVSRGGSSWTGDFLFGALRGQHIRRVCFAGERVTCNEALFQGRFGRVRTVVEGPDGALYALTSNRDARGSPRQGDDRLLRIVPPAG